MKSARILVAVLLLGAIVSLSLSCSSGSNSAAAKSSVATVQKGSLSVSVTGTGNLALSTSQDLAFQIAGYVSEVLVKEGQSVTKGQELAKLDTSEWDKQIKKLDSALVTAQRNLDSKQRALVKAQDQVTAKNNAITKAERQVTASENAIAKAQRQVTAKEMAVRSAELDVESAQNSVMQISDVKRAQDSVDAANFHIDFVDSVLKSSMGLQISDYSYWVDQKNKAKDELVTAQQQLADILKGTSTQVTSNIALQIKKAQLQVEQAQRAVEEANIAVADAKFAVDDALLVKKDAELAVKDANTAKADAQQGVADAQTAVGDAQQSVADAQGDLDEAKSLSPIITAPIDGFIPKINVKGGDEVFKGTVAMQLADPNQFEAVILVSEKNVANLKVGQPATIGLDALAGMSFPAQITKVATMATTSSGVVNYQVTVKLASLQPINRTATMQGAVQGAGAAPTATASVPQGGTGNSRTPAASRPAGTSQTGTAARVPGTGTSAVPTATAVSVKSGMSAVVTVIIQSKDNVLKVPSRAITRQGQNTTVEVVTANGNEVRTVKTGMSDSSNTEITEGLNEGEQVVIKASTSPTTTSSPNRNQAPGIGGLLR